MKKIEVDQRGDDIQFRRDIHVGVEEKPPVRWVSKQLPDFCWWQKKKRRKRIKRMLIFGFWRKMIYLSPFLRTMNMLL